MVGGSSDSPLKFDNPLIEGLVHGDGTAFFLFFIVIGGVFAAEILKLGRGKEMTKFFSRPPNNHPFLLGFLDFLLILLVGPFMAVLLIAPVTGKECVIAGLSWIALAQSASKD